MSYPDIPQSLANAVRVEHVPKMDHLPDHKEHWSVSVDWPLAYVRVECDSAIQAATIKAQLQTLVYNVSAETQRQIRGALGIEE